MKNASKYLLSLALTSLAAGAQAQLVIDPFSAAQNTGVPVSGVPNPAINSLSTASVLGGARDLQSRRISGGSTVDTVVDPTFGGGTFTLATAPGTVGEAVANYDGSADNTISNSGLGGIDITNGGGGLINDGFLGEFTSDLGATFTVTLFDGANSVSATANIPGDPTFTFNTFALPFSSFTGGVVDLTSIDAVRLTITGPAGTDVGVRLLRFSTTSPVPEPGSVALLGGMVTLGGLALRRRVRK